MQFSKSANSTPNWADLNEELFDDDMDFSLGPSAYRPEQGDIPEQGESESESEDDLEPSNTFLGYHGSSEFSQVLLKRSSSGILDQVHMYEGQEAVRRAVPGVKQSTSDAKRMYRDWDGTVLATGEQVVVVRMSRSPRLQGLQGTILSHDTKRGLYTVQLANRAEPSQVQLHRSNLLVYGAGGRAEVHSKPLPGRNDKAIAPLQGRWRDSLDPLCSYDVKGWKCVRTVQTKKGPKSTTFEFELDQEKQAICRGRKSRVFFYWQTHDSTEESIRWDCENGENLDPDEPNTYSWVRPGTTTPEPFVTRSPGWDSRYGQGYRRWSSGGNLATPPMSYRSPPWMRGGRWFGRSMSGGNWRAA